MGLKPVLPSWSKWHWLHILPSSYAVGYRHRHTCAIFPRCFDQWPCTLSCSLAHLLPAACKHTASRPTSLLCLQRRGTVCGYFGNRSLYFHFVTARVRENHEIAQGSRWGTLFSVTPRKSFVITQLKSYPVKIESNISSPHPLVQGQSSLFAVSYFSRPPPPSIHSHFLRSPFAPFPPTPFYLLPNLVHGLIFWCNYPGNDSRAGLHLKAI